MLGASTIKYPFLLIFYFGYLQDKNDLIEAINPKITHKDGELVYQEGCLSVPGFYEDITRTKWSDSWEEEDSKTEREGAKKQTEKV